MTLTTIHNIGGGERLPEAVQVFIGSVSYEERCLSVATWLQGSKVDVAVVAENMNHEELHRGNGERLRALFGNVVPVDLNTGDPLATADGLRNALGHVAVTDGSLVMVDITTFTHEALLILFQLVRRQFRHCRVIYAYAAAREYAVGLKPEDKWLSRGVEDVRSVLGYSGVFRPSRKLHLIALVGFEHERISELITQYEPSAISLGYGDTPVKRSSVHVTSALAGYRRLTALYGQAGQFKFSCFNPVATKDTLLEVAEWHPKCNVVIAALNTKLSTLGAAAAATENEELQLCYAQAMIYNTRGYSAPGNDLYLFSF